MTAILKQLDAGVAGDVTRENAAIIEYGAIDGDLPYGKAAVYDSTKVAFRAIATSDTADKVYGIRARVAPATPDTAQGAILVRGYIKAAVNGTPKRGEKVYIQTTEDGTKKVGDLVAEATTGKTIESGFVFAVEGVDENGVTVIRKL